MKITSPQLWRGRWYHAWVGRGQLEQLEGTAVSEHTIGQKVKCEAPSNEKLRMIHASR